MKKSILFITLVTLSFGIFAQGNVVWRDVDKKLLPDTVTMHIELGHSDIVFDAFISNITSTDYNVLLKRTIISYVSGGSDQLCYGMSCQVGDKDRAEIVTDPDEQKGNVDVSTTEVFDMIHYLPKGNKGTTILKYYILTRPTSGDDILQDSVVVKYVKDFIALNFEVDMSACPDFDGTGDVIVSGSFGDDVVMTLKKNNIYETSVIVDAETDYTYSYSWNSQVSAEYDVSILSVDGETDDSWVVGINGEDLFSDLKIYPNPFNNTLTINNIEDATMVEITNIVGQTVYLTTSLSNKMLLSTSDLKTGMYFITITDSNSNVYTERVIKR